MGKLPFNQNILEWIVDNRFEPLTSIFLFFTFMGAELGYILLVLSIYWLYNKKLALRLAMVTISSSVLNHLIKISIRNPRPFVSDGTYTDNWAISEGSMEETAQEFSTPSGHAMGSASFWSYLHKKINSRFTLVISIIFIVMIGLSRPYLGVHYVEDIILGWTLGLMVTYLILRYEETISKWWKQFSIKLQIIMTISFTSTIWIIAGVLSEYDMDGQNFATFGGLISGLIVGSSLETKHINFKSGIRSPLNGIIKFIIGLAVSLSIFLGLDALFATITEDDTFLGFLLRYIRYLSLGLTATILVGWIFIKTNLSELNESVNTD